MSRTPKRSRIGAEACTPSVSSKTLLPSYQLDGAPLVKIEKLSPANHANESAIALEILISSHLDLRVDNMVTRQECSWSQFWHSLGGPPRIEVLG